MTVPTAPPFQGDREKETVPDPISDPISPRYLTPFPLTPFPPCRDFHSQVEVPAGHAHVKVLGSYVLDSEADHGWMEIHPVTSMVPE
jgi:hypothetical protein